MTDKYAPDPAQVQQTLELVTRLRDTAGSDQPKSRRLLDIGIRALRAVARLGGTSPNEEAANELRGLAADMNTELDDTLVPSVSTIAARAHRAVEYLSQSPANVAGARDEAARVGGGMGGIAARLISGAMSGGSDSPSQPTAEGRRRFVEALGRTHTVMRLANELSTELTREPVDLPSVRTKAQVLAQAADDLVNGQAGKTP